MDTNPYQSPQTSYAVDADGQYLQMRVEGKSLVVPTDTVLPPVCIRTNHRRGMFWVKGCSGEFLAEIEAEAGQDPFRSVETSL